MPFCQCSVILFIILNKSNQCVIMFLKMENLQIKGRLFMLKVQNVKNIQNEKRSL